MNETDPVQAAETPIEHEGVSADALQLLAGRLHNCAHCRGTGTCKNGKDGTSCGICAHKLNAFRERVHFGLACDTCGGLGKTSTRLHKLQQKATPYLAYSITVGSFLLVLVFGAFGYFSKTEPKVDYFNEVMAVCTTLLGAVTGYYFSSRNQSGDSA